jgi:AcrR family transcriptional regulator
MATRKATLPDGLTREERTRKEILAATRTLIELHGFAKLTLDDIAGSLGKRKSFLYYYYPDKEAILAAAIEAESQEMQRVVDMELAKAKHGLAKIHTYILVCHQEVLKRAPLLKHLRNEIQVKNHSTLGLVLEKSSEMMKMDLPLITEILREGVRDGSIRKFSAKEIDAMAHFVTLTLHGIEYGYILGDVDAQFEVRLRIALTILEHGIAAA